VAGLLGQEGDQELTPKDSGEEGPEGGEKNSSALNFSGPDNGKKKNGRGFFLFYRAKKKMREKKNGGGKHHRESKTPINFGFRGIK